MLDRFEMAFGAPAHANERPAHLVEVSAAAWDAADFDPVALDAQVAAAARSVAGFRVRVVSRREHRRPVTAVAGEVLIRYQRFATARNSQACGPTFDQVLARHRAIHDLTKPLVAADFDHALDTWRWVLRLDWEASLPLQIAALFHDVERLASEADVRVEQHAPDYAAFKQQHAAAGAAAAQQILAPVVSDPALLERVTDLIANHERPGRDPEKALLNTADALSFFSLNACGFISHYGPAHTRRKIAYTLDRLAPEARAWLGQIRHRADIAAMLSAEAQA
jgi:hypothetical protein